MRGYQNYEGKEHTIPKVVAPACAAVALRLRAGFASALHRPSHTQPVGIKL
jgi:hypothetical protein